MEFSNRDSAWGAGILKSQRGQAVTEYILVLVVVVGMVLGGIYQLNDAFKSWANNYFGNYLACLLETGDLPSIGGTSGDASVCNQLFKPFNLQDGRPRLTPSSNSAGASSASSGGGAKENQRSGSNGAAGNYNPINSSGSRQLGRGGNGSGASGGKLGSKDEPTNTGNTSVSNYGGGYHATNQKLDTGTKTRLDNRFAFDEESADKQKRRQLASPAKSTTSDGQGAPRSRLRPNGPRKDIAPTADTQMTFGNFLRWLIIAALVIALVLFIGSQMLQIGKSME